MNANQVRAEMRDFMTNFVPRNGVILKERLESLRRELYQADDLSAALEEKRAVFEMREYIGSQQDVLPYRARDLMAQQLADATERAAKLRRILRVMTHMAGEAEIIFSTKQGEAA